MDDAALKAVRLADYAPPPWLVDEVQLTFRLAPRATRVVSRIAFRPNPDRPGTHPLALDGEGLTLLRAAIDGAPVAPELGAGALICPAPDRPFVWEAEVEIDPQANTALEGLYTSKGMYCTQCEAEGFRRITYYPDRPDVMAPFTVRIEGPAETAPVMLSNGNPVEAGPGYAVWHDPWPKPAYLFALVAGDLVALRDSFTTASGREVALAIHVRPGDEGRCGYAMGALKRAMRWDEKTYGREYDLDVFNIVAVDDFNMGAMENKGLNVFNAKYVLASPETATDADYERIEGIVAHEYFHNWTGNRVTCRDWFQLCLKEGLTVFRDQQFSADQRSAPVKRIADVQALRGRQFREDTGPLAHPVRPESYVEINNFYTATVYEKGAEVIGMLRRLVGAEGYRAALDLYFARHDGQAVTIEDWLAVFEDATGRDLDQFKRWYTQAGTPRLRVDEEYADGTYALTFRQHTPTTPGQPDKGPQTIPVAVGLLAPDGREVLPTRVVEITETAERIRFEGLAERPVPSLLRGFSAPVILERAASVEERAFLLSHDTDPFNRWWASRSLAEEVLARMVVEGAAAGPDYLSALALMAGDTTLDPAFRALALALPTEDEMAQALAERGDTPDPTAIHIAVEKLTGVIAAELAPVLGEIYTAMEVPGPYSPEPRAAGCRALRQVALSYLSRYDSGRRAAAHYAAAGNMTEQIGALGCLLDIGAGAEESAAFARQWSHDPLVMDKWCTLQVARGAPGDAVARAERLAARTDFDWQSPNRFRAVVGALPLTPAGFHHPSGEGYRFLADWLIRLDGVNPQTAARMTTPFETWPRYGTERRAMIGAELDRIASQPGLSDDTGEMVNRIRNG